MAASRKVFRYTDWLIRAPASRVKAAKARPKALVLAEAEPAAARKPSGVIENSS